MTMFERLALVGDRMFDRLRDRRAFAITDNTAINGGLDVLRRHKYAVVVTFRRNGDPVPSPVWFGVDDRGRAYLRTDARSGKVKRLSHDNRILIAPSNIRGRPMGPGFRATGRVLPKQEWPHAEDTLAGAYGLGRRIWERLLGGSTDGAAYIEIEPGRGTRPQP